MKFSRKKRQLVRKLSKPVLLHLKLVRFKMVNLKTKARLKVLLKLKKEPSKRLKKIKRRSKQQLRVRRQLQKVKMLILKAKINLSVKRMNLNLSLVSVREVCKRFSQLRMIRKQNSRKLLSKILITQLRILMDI